MVKKKIKNFLITLKNKIKKKNIIKKSLIQNNFIEIQKIYFFNLKKIYKKKIKTTQFSISTKNTKKKIWLNRWEINKLYYENDLINYKKWQK